MIEHRVCFGGKEFENSNFGFLSVNNHFEKLLKLIRSEIVKSDLLTRLSNLKFDRPFRKQLFYAKKQRRDVRYTLDEVIDRLSRTRKNDVIIVFPAFRVEPEKSRIKRF